MSTINKKSVNTKPSKKDLKHDIIQKLETALVHLKEMLGEKKFNAKIKKASKIFTHATPKKPKVKKVKTVVKKVIPAAKKIKPAKKKAATKPKTVKKS